MSATLLDQADQNLPDSVRILTRWQPAARCLELSGVMLHQGTLPLPLPFQNCVFRLDQAVRPEQVLQQAQAFFGGSANPYAVITQSRRDLDLDAHLASQGFHEQSNLAAMLAEAPVPVPSLAPGYRVEIVRSVDDVKAFVQVCATAYESLGLPAFFTPSYFVDEQAMLAAPATLVLARDAQGQPLATALSLHTGEVAGLYWVGAVPTARKQGLAAACTALATNLAFEQGARAVTLQATPMGEATYRHLGFQEYGRMARWSL
jgi:hypothetical protein